MRSITSVSGITSRSGWMNISAGNRQNCRFPADCLWLINNGCVVACRPSVWHLIAYPRLSMLSTDGLTIAMSCSGCRAAVCSAPVLSVCFMAPFLDGSLAKAIPFPVMAGPLRFRVPEVEPQLHALRAGLRRVADRKADQPDFTPVEICRGQQFFRHAPEGLCRIDGCE